MPALTISPAGSPQCWLYKDVAAALVEAANEAETEGVRLVVHDCYRPHRVTKAFLR